MKLKIIYTIISVFFVSFFVAQDTIRVYYTKDGVETDNKNMATYYRKAFMDADKRWIAKDYSMNNRVQMTGVYKSKKLNSKHGHFIYFFENGEKKSEGEFIDNMAEGVWKYWHENGQLKSEGKIIYNKKEGLWSYLYENGSKKSEGSYVADKHENTWTYWYESGEKKSEGKLLNDARVGVWNFWYKNGFVDAEEVYENGVMISSIHYFDNGMKRIKKHFSGDKKSGEWVYWNIDEKIYLRGSYLNDVKNGEWVRYFQNGDNLKIYYDNGVIKGEPLGGVMQNE